MNLELKILKNAYFAEHLHAATSLKKKDIIQIYLFRSCKYKITLFNKFIACMLRCFIDKDGVNIFKY